MSCEESVHPRFSACLGGDGEGPTGRSWGQLLWDTSPVAPPSLSPPLLLSLSLTGARPGWGSHGCSSNLDSSCGQVGAFSWERPRMKGRDLRGFTGEEVERQRSLGGRDPGPGARRTLGCSCCVQGEVQGNGAGRGALGCGGLRALKGGVS